MRDPKPNRVGFEKSHTSSYLHISCCCCCCCCCRGKPSNPTPPLSDERKCTNGLYERTLRFLLARFSQTFAFPRASLVSISRLHRDVGVCLVCENTQVSPTSGTAGTWANSSAQHDVVRFRILRVVFESGLETECTRLSSVRSMVFWKAYVDLCPWNISYRPNQPLETYRSEESENEPRVAAYRRLLGGDHRALPPRVGLRLGRPRDDGLLRTLRQVLRTPGQRPCALRKQRALSRNTRPHQTAFYSVCVLPKKGFETGARGGWTRRRSASFWVANRRSWRDSRRKCCTSTRPRRPSADCRKLARVSFFLSTAFCSFSKNH